uniref:Uncharacterized protein n=1 Tax=Lepeophtheirus salmonis TaxID=72036 RepID=A0A0K2UBI3_LEPSM
MDTLFLICRVLLDCEIK